MADEFLQAEVCGSSWWINSSRNMLGSSSPNCASGISDLGGFGWPNHDLLDMKAAAAAARSSDESGGSASDGSIVIQDIQKPSQPDSASGSCVSSLSMDSSLQILGIGLSSSSTTDWNRALLHGNNGRNTTETNYPSMLQEDQSSSMNYRQSSGVEQMQKDWTLKNFSTLIEDSSINFSLDQQQKRLNSIPSSTPQCTTTCQSLSTGGFPISSASYGYSSTLLQNLFESDPQPQQQQQESLYGNRSINYPVSANNYHTNLNIEFFPPPLPKFSPLTNSLLPRQFLNNNTNFTTNASIPQALNDFCPNNPFASDSKLLASTFNEKRSLLNLTRKPRNEDVQGIVGSVAKKNSSEPAFKRPRIETPSPLPTFKVRKEKLGDRITALQQLVSPFGKTDTASVLHEAIEYIKFLHDQVGVLSTPYLRNGSQAQRHQSCDIKTREQEEAKQDLKGRGLCLVPISSTFPVAAENTTDFWTPTFGGTFR